jgi:hypothetical protein
MVSDVRAEDGDRSHDRSHDRSNAGEAGTKQAVYLTRRRGDAEESAEKSNR